MSANENNNQSTPSGENVSQPGLVPYSPTNSSVEEINQQPDGNKDTSPEIVILATETQPERPQSPTDSFSSADFDIVDKDWSFGGDDCVAIEPAPTTTVAAIETPAGEPELGHRRSLAKVFGVKTIAVATRKCKQLGPLARLIGGRRSTRRMVHTSAH